MTRARPLDDDDSPDSPDDSTHEDFFRNMIPEKKGESLEKRRADYHATIPEADRGIPGFSDNERRRFAEVCAAGGLVDAWRASTS